MTNIAEGEPSVALLPSHRGHLEKKKRKEKILAAPALCKDMNILPDKNPLEESPRGARMSRSVVRRLLVWL